MTIGELKAVHAAMPTGEWIEDGGCIVRANPDYGKRPQEPQYFRVLYGEIPDGSRRGIVALHNHFPALLARLERAEELLRPFANWLGEYGADNIAVNAVASYEAAAAFLANANKPLEVRS